MTSRLRDVLPITLGGYLVLLGGTWLLATTGTIEVSAAGMVGIAFGLAFVFLGILAILAALRVRRVARQLRRAIGHVHSSSSGWAVEDGVIQTVFGDILLDLREATLPDGESELTLLCWLGTIQVRVPADIGVEVQAQAIIGSVDVLGRREEGLVRDLQVRTPDFDRSPRRLRMRVSTVIGEILVVQSGERRR